MMITGIGLLAIGAAAAGIAYVVLLARRGQLGPVVLTALSVLCAIVLLAMLITDWPTEALSEFWRDHSVISATASAVLLVGVGFLAFEAVDVHKQELINSNLTAAGLGGLVDILVDIEVALSLVQQDTARGDDVCLWNWNDRVSADGTSRDCDVP
jgi:hypothetical protein